jgi:hypothetical protein
MKYSLWLIVFLAGFGGGWLFSTVDLMSHSNPAVAPTGHAHDHPQREVASELVPTVSVRALPDTKDGFNLQIETTNFSWSPERVNGVVLENEGHAHVYVNDVKVARVYGPWFHLPSELVAPGPNRIMVTLNANDHSEWIHNGEHVMAVTEVTGPVR